MKHTHNKESVGVFIIWIVAGLFLSLFLLIARAEAGAHTMHLVDSYIDDDVKVCVYSDGRHYAEVERARGSNCPYTHIEY